MEWEERRAEEGAKRRPALSRGLWPHGMGGVTSGRGSKNKACVEPRALAPASRLRFGGRASPLLRPSLTAPPSSCSCVPSEALQSALRGYRHPPRRRRRGGVKGMMIGGVLLAHAQRGSFIRPSLSSNPISSIGRSFLRPPPSASPSLAAARRPSPLPGILRDGPSHDRLLPQGDALS